MGKACSTHRGDQKCVHNFSRQTLRKEEPGDPTRVWENDIKEILMTLWIQLAQDSTSLHNMSSVTVAWHRNVY